MKTRRSGRLIVVVTFLAVAFGAGCDQNFLDIDGFGQHQTESPSVAELQERLSTGDWQEVQVSWVIDGDTIDITVDDAYVPVPDSNALPPGRHRIRLLGIDAPERDEQCFSEATAHLAALSPVNSTVFLEAAGQDHDRFGRPLRYVWVQQPGTTELTNTSTNMVSHGWAKDFVWDDRRPHSGSIKHAAASAQRQGIGIWGTACAAPNVEAAND